MRASWQQATPKPLSKNQIAFMCMAVFGSDDYEDAQPLSHGRSHQNYLLTLATGQKVVLRVTDNKQNLQKQFSLAQKLWRKLPVPRFLSAPLAANGHKYFVFLEFKQGERLANIEQLPTADHAQLGFELGEYLALLHSQTFTSSGDFDANLKIAQTYDKDYPHYFGEFLTQAVKLKNISNAQAKKFTSIFKSKISILNQWQHVNCLLHADLNEDNILHHQGHISAILDWEFVMSGHPAMDFGKFTRTPYINCPVFLENLCDSYYLTHKSLPANWDDIAMLVDLMAWAEFLTRKNLNPDVKMSALEKLATTLDG